MSRLLVVCAVVLSVVASAFARAPLLEVPAAQLVQGSYLVILHDNVTAELKNYHMDRYTAIHGVAVSAVWTIVNGYAATISTDAALEALLEDPLVSYIEQDQIVSIDYKQEQHPISRPAGHTSFSAADDTVATQNLGTSATGLWGLARSWQRAYTQKTSFQYWASAGADVDVYVVDTGINAAHTEFAGRFDTTCSTTFVSDPSYPLYNDGNGHGTHVASTSAGTVYGLAKKATICAVKVLSSGGSGTNAGVVSGINYVAQQYGIRKKKSVANMSLGGGASATTDAAVNAAVAAGVTMAVAAGNENQNACNVSPARAASAFTVGSTTIADARSSFSNFGTCVKIFAPGSNILGAWIGSSTATNTISGTSMASPHVCGAVALYLGHATTNPTPASVLSALVAAATPDVITSVGTGSPNKLLFAATS